MPDPVPFYPELRCHMAPLRAARAPEPECDCKVCGWARDRASAEAQLASVTDPIRPGGPDWAALLEIAR